MTALGAVVVAVCLFAAALDGPVLFDENMYIAAGVLARDHRIYCDFAYLQTPYTPLLHALVYRLFDVTHFLLAARLVSFALSLIAALCLITIARKLVPPRIVPLIALLFAGSEIVQLRSATTGNDFMAATACLGALALIIPDGGRRVTLRAFGAGFLLTVATGCKLYYATLLPVICVIAAGREVSGRARRAMSFACGVALAGAPIVVFFLRAPSVVTFDLYGYHALNARWRQLAGHPASSLSGKTLVLVKTLALPTSVLLLFVLLYLGLTRYRSGLISRAREAGLLAIASALALVTALVPSPAWPHYLMMPVTVAVVLVPVLFADIGEGAQQSAFRVLACAAALVTVFGVARLGRHLTVLGRPSMVTTIHEDALKLRARVGTGRVATLFPIYALEAGLPIYPSLSTAAFAYRVGDMLDPRTRRDAVVTSPRTVGAVFDEEPPATLLVGFEPEPPSLEGALVDWARAHGYREEPMSIGGLDARIFQR
jgi:hypothetical protein